MKFAVILFGYGVQKDTVEPAKKSPHLFHNVLLVEQIARQLVGK